MTGYQTPQGGPDPDFRSRSCVTGAHEECGHLGFPGLGLRVGGRSPLVLCRCRCHLTCTLAGRLGASHSIWVGLCDCPGTELAEARINEAARDFPDMKRLVRERQQERVRERQQEREARVATRAAAAGKSRQQIREIYVGQLRARGLTVPSALMLDATADAIARNREKFSVAYSARLVAEAGRDLWRLRQRPDEHQ
jgi:hypothetical protein